jgi:hypothetical protein
MSKPSTRLEDLQSALTKRVNAHDLARWESAGPLLRQFEKLQLAHYKTDLHAFDTFLPPRLVDSAKKRELVGFFGAGVSAEAGVPLWWDLLSTLGIPHDMGEEPELEHDPLTAAEVIAHRVGIQDLDEALRHAILKSKTPAVPHLLLAQLFQAVYVTTNYDTLFENAWKMVHGVEPEIVTTDADLVRLNSGTLHTSGDCCVLFKLHGCVKRSGEELVLTRSQYRRHYRTNRVMFDAVRDVLGRSNTLFLGFGHRDPEITRLVDDVIHNFETRESDAAKHHQPAFYSLQFNMRERTPEIFAARGIVALRPPISLEPPDGIDPRTLALTRSLTDLLGAIDSDIHDDLNLDESLAEARDRLSAEILGGIEKLDVLVDTLSGDPRTVEQSELAICGERLDTLAGQGVYVLDVSGDTIESWQPPGLTSTNRRDANFRERPYVRQAQMYRQPFASTTVESMFNGNATAFLCVPIVAPDETYRGLVFSAFQVGSWQTPLDLQRELKSRYATQEVSFLLVDNNGVLLLPPNTEFPPREVQVEGESEAANLGFEFERLRRLSRRDKLVERIWNNIVPLAQDDDVIRLGEVEMYSVVTEVKHTRWKLALSIAT